MAGGHAIPPLSNVCEDDGEEFAGNVYSNSFRQPDGASATAKLVGASPDQCTIKNVLLKR
jgi:hypothetical protein